MNKDENAPKQGIDGVHSDFPLTPKDPPKIKTKKDRKKEPNFLLRLYKRIIKRKAL